MRTKSIFFIILIILIGSGHGASSLARRADNASYRYLYTIQEESGQITLNAIILDENNTPSDITIQTFDVTRRLHQVISSPDGRWLAFATSPDAFDNQSNIYLVHLVDYEVIQLEREIFFPRTTEANINDHFQQFAWSSDSRLLAYISASKVYLYDVESHSSTPVVTGDMVAYRLLWSENSNNLVIFGEECIKSCAGFIRAYDNAGKLQTSLELYEVPTGFGAMSICSLGVSPDGITVSFTFLCDYSFLEAKKELFTASLTAPTDAVQITRFTDLGIRPPEAPAKYRFRFAVYQTQWLEGGKLLIGASFAQDSVENVHNQILVYDPSSDTQKILIDGKTFLETAINSNLIAFVLAEPQAYFSAANTEIALVELNNNLDVVDTYAGGCNLQWNPNEHILAYARASTNNFEPCLTRPRELVFIDIFDGTVAEYQLPETGQINVIGWVPNHMSEQ